MIHLTDQALDVCAPLYTRWWRKRNRLKVTIDLQKAHGTKNSRSHISKTITQLANPSIHPSIHPPIHPSICLSVRLSVYPPSLQSVSPFVRPSIFYQRITRITITCVGKTKKQKTKNKQTNKQINRTYAGKAAAWKRNAYLVHYTPVKPPRGILLLRTFASSLGSTIFARYLFWNWSPQMRTLFRSFFVNKTTRKHIPNFQVHFFSLLS